MKTFTLKFCLLILGASFSLHSKAGSGAGSDLKIPIDSELAELHSVTSSIQPNLPLLKIASLLAKPAKSRRQLAYALFYWISQNIAYDTKGFFSGDFGDLTPEGVLRRRKAVCSGYARLFSGLAEAAGLEVVEITGKSKGFGFAESGQLGDHAWNAVKIDGQWYLVDTTWGAGYVKDNRTYQARLQPFYFMSPPEQFVYTHLPNDPKWQLLDPPISEAEFRKRVYLRPGFFQYGLQLDSHIHAFVQTDNPVETFTIKAPQGIVAMMDLLQGQNELPATQTFIQRQADRLRIQTAFPQPGEYQLLLYAKPKTVEGSYDAVAQYRIQARQTSASGFPKTFSTFAESNAYLTGPLTATLKKGRSHDFSISVPGAVEVSVIDGQAWHALQSDNFDFSGSVPIASEDVTIAAKLSEDDEGYSFLVKYQGID